MVFINPPGYSHIHGIRSGTSKRYSVTISSNLSPVKLYIPGPCLTSSSNKNRFTLQDDTGIHCLLQQ